MRLLLHDLIIFPISKNPRNMNMGSFYAYPHFTGVLQTGLIGAFFILFFRITDHPAQNPKQEISTGEKPASLFPFGWRIGSQITFSPWKGKKTCFDLAWYPSRMLMVSWPAYHFRGITFEQSP